MSNNKDFLRYILIFLPLLWNNFVLILSLFVQKLLFKIALSDQRPNHYLFGKLNTSEFVQKLAAYGIVDAKVFFLIYKTNNSMIFHCYKL